MKCNWEWLSVYLDDLLSDDKRAKLEEHLKTCEACATKLVEFARVEQAAKKIPAPQLSEAYWENFAGRVQNKLTIRERRKTTPAWLEAFKSFFEPTTGKLAIAGSLATLLLVAIIGQDYWRKETYQPPKFEAVAPPVNDKIDSVQVGKKDESGFRTARPDEKNVVTEKKRENEIASAKVVDDGILDSRENAPAALAPAEIASKPAGRQKSKEEPSLVGYVGRDEAIKGDTVLVSAGKKAEETEKAPLQNRGSLQKRSLVASPTKSQAPSSVANDTADLKPKIEASDLAASAVSETTADVAARYKSTSKPTLAGHTERDVLIEGDTIGFRPRGRLRSELLALETKKLVSDIRQLINEKEKELKGDLSKSETESLYVFLAQHYVQLYRSSLNAEDWKRADQRITDFLKTDLSKSTRQQLVAIQAELKKLKK